MFNLKRIINGRVNVSEPLLMASGVTDETTFTAGTAVAFVSGKLTVVSGDKKAEYIVHSTTDCKEADDKVPLILVTPDMLFETTVSADPDSMVIGGRYQIETEGTKVTATAVTDTAAESAGAYLVDKLGATDSGDTILVRLA